VVSWPEHSAAYAICERLQTLIDSHPGSPLLYANVARENSLVAAAGAGNTDTAETVSFNLNPAAPAGG